MADKEISSLPAAASITDADLFVLQQGGAAKKLTGAILRKYAHDIDSASINAQGHLILSLKGGETVDAGALPAGPGTGDMLASIYDAAQGRKQVAFKTDLDTVRQSLENAVLTTAQSLTDAQQTQARGNIGAAPSGYGLGEPYGKSCPVNADGVQDLNLAVLCGLYSVYHSSSTTPPLNDPSGNFGYGILRVERFRNVVQTYYHITTASGKAQVARRVSYTDDINNWSPWEWINPALTLGVEYRTTERYLGRPVYCKLVNFGALPNNAVKTVAHGISKLQYAVSVTGESNGDNLIGNMYVTYVHVGSLNIRIQTNTDRSAVTATVLIKYTKSTD